MFGSTTLDIVLGLVLVYLLYSLLVTILGEIVATRLGIRARLLRRAIGTMLNDDVTFGKANLVYRAGRVFRSQIKNIFITEEKSFDSSFAGRFYNHPSMKYLSTGKVPGFFSESKGKPSYITSRNFSETMVHIIREHGEGDTDALMISSSLEKSVKALAKKKSSGDAAITEAALRKPDDNIAAPLVIEPETLKHLTNLWMDASQNVEKFKHNLEKWFEDTMDRVTGWFTRRMKVILFLLGFLIAMSFNVSSIEIVRHLSKDKEARSQLVAMSVALANDTTRYAKGVIRNDTGLSKGLLDTAYHKIEKDIDDANRILALGWDLKHLEHECIIMKPVSRALNDLFSKRKHFDSLKKEYTEKQQVSSDFAQSLSSSMLNNQELFKLHFDTVNHPSYFLKRKLDSLKLTVYDARRKHYAALLIQLQDSLSENRAAFNSIANTCCTSIQQIDSNANGYEIHCKRLPNSLEKLSYVASRPFASWQSFLGFFLTALAISLGSSFWFDLLKKLVSIRGTGVKPEEKEEKKA